LNVTGVIVEYNPLHNGHVYHLEMTKKITGCDYVIGVMSGNFVQRGEPALINKWSRAEAALKAGVDLLIELPVIYSISSAEGFAFGAISILSNTKIVDNICFGSEYGSLDKLKIIAEILTEEPDDYKSMLQKYLKFGLSYPSARQNALIDYLLSFKNPMFEKNEIEDILLNSNNILAIEYLKSINKLSSNIKPYSIKRIVNKYNEPKITGPISSATSIRKNINNFDEIRKSIPIYSEQIIKREIESGRGPVFIDDLSDLIFYKLRNSDISFIKDLIDVGEGLENRIKLASENSTNVHELIQNIKNKRYTSTRIQRILINALLGITKDVANKIQSSANYIRILGFNDNGKKLIREIKQRCTLPVITNPSPKDMDLLKYDINATDIYVLAYKNHEFKKAKQDLLTPPVII
jgi:predicted nucleotidyltransferase